MINSINIFHFLFRFSFFLTKGKKEKEKKKERGMDENEKKGGLVFENGELDEEENEEMETHFFVKPIDEYSRGTAFLQYVVTPTQTISKRDFYQHLLNHYKNKSGNEFHYGLFDRDVNSFSKEDDAYIVVFPGGIKSALIGYAHIQREEDVLFLTIKSISVYKDNAVVKQQFLTWLREFSKQ
jgi:hypothetical protein